MSLKSKTFKSTALAVLIALFGTIFLTSCGKDTLPDSSDDSAVVVGCNQVRYQGFTYTITGCSQSGVSSFDVTVTQNGHSASFHITCSGGCIATATPN